MSSDLLVEDGGKVSLPEDVRERYGLTQDTPVRIIETRGGILLVPLTREPMSAELKRELDEWQSLSTSNIEMFPYDEEGGEVNVGDIHWVELPPRDGHAQAGRRPAIIVQSDARASSLPTVLLIPLTTQMDALRFPGTVLIETDALNNLRRASVALVFQLTAVDRRFIVQQLGEVAQATLQQIWIAFDELTDRI